MNLARPPPIAPGDLVSVVAPSSPVPRDEFWRGLAWLRARYRIQMSAGVFARDGYLAGSDERRKDEISRALMDDEVKAIVAARGGYGALRFAHLLPWSALARRPKWIVGFSDVTALHSMCWRAGVASLHAPNVTGLGPEVTPSTRASWLAPLERTVSSGEWTGLSVVRSGTASGPLVGGNLAVLHALAAAGSLEIPAGAVLALEDVGEAPYRIDRMLTSLVLGGHLAGVAAIVFGDFERCGPGHYGRTAQEVFDLCTRPLGVPVVAGAPFGHAPRNEAFVIGAIAEVRGDRVSWS
ncbi:MAG TPA: LD-carboxypeptidase [Polyangiaceae bacterium]